MRILLGLVCGAVLFGVFGLACFSMTNPFPPRLLVTQWTRSFELYGQPHAIWLSLYDYPGVNLEKLRETLNQAERRRQYPEIVIYSIPLRDLGQSSEGGFETYEAYWKENLLNAREIKVFVEKTGLTPRVYLEPDALPLAVQYRRDYHFNEESVDIYNERVAFFPKLIKLYQEAGAKVYLDGAHSDWFDYGEEDLKRIAGVLNDAGIHLADGLATNTSNRQPVVGQQERDERHYVGRLLPYLNNANLDVVVDTSRNGGKTHQRQYYLEPSGRLIDNEVSTGRLVGSWFKDDQGEIWLKPFHGKLKLLSKLYKKEKYTYIPHKQLLKAPPWLDAVGDVQPGPPPTDEPPASVRSVIHRYRYIKPPDDCDGAVHCPPGDSKHDINQALEKLQPSKDLVLPNVWERS